MFQSSETSPVAYDTAPRFTMTWMTENLHQQVAIMLLGIQFATSQLTILVSSPRCNEPSEFSLQVQILQWSGVWQ